MPTNLPSKRRSFSSQPLSKPVFKRALVIFLGIVCLGLLIGLPIYSQYEKNLRTTAITAAAQRTALIERTIHAEFNKLISDLKVLSALPTLRTLIYSDQLNAAHPLTNYLANVLLNDRRYDQIRLLDRHGRELIRIVHRNNRTFFIAESELRDRSESDYVLETLSLIPGQIYVSPMQRNTGDDRVENPNIPVIRLGTQLQDEFGRVRGLMVLDYRAQGMLDSFNAILADTTHERTFMFGRAGSWLYSQGANALNLQEDPLSANNAGSPLAQAWPRMKGLDKGQVHTPNGLYSIETVYPLMFDPGAIPNAHLSQELGVPPTLVEHYRWRLVTYIPNEAWLSKSVLRQPLGLFGLVLLSVLLALIVYETVAAWSYKNALRRERERTAAELENLYEDAPCGYHSLSPQGVVVRMNRTELNWLGYSKEEVIGKKHYADLLAPSSRDQFLERFNAFMTGGVINDFGISLQRRDGSLLPVTIHATAVRGLSGDILEIRATALDLTERYQLEQELRRQAYTDPLTGVYNRRHFFELSDRHMRQAARTQQPIAVCMIDIDHFKTINDTHGHEVGDRVLVTVSRLCSESLRPIDLFARMGGEEFALLLPNTSHTEALAVANRIRETLSSLRIGLPDGQSIAVTVSIGVASGFGTEETLDQLLRQADARLYTAKQHGRNRVC